MSAGLTDGDTLPFVSGQITIEREGPLAWIVFDHPERRNAITADMWVDIPRVAQELDADDSVRVVVLRGAGDVAFVSGADISEFEERRSGPQGEAYEQRNVEAFEALSGIEKPTLAAIHGFCIGGGCALALTADLRFAADDAVFAIPAGRLGLGYMASGIETLVRTVGLPAAKELFFTARRVGAEDARGMGLLNRVLPKAELDDHVRELALGIADNAPLTLRAAKLAMREIGKREVDRDDDAVLAAIRACFASEDYAEGVRAFLEKRRPAFTGR